MNEETNNIGLEAYVKFMNEARERQKGYKANIYIKGSVPILDEVQKWVNENPTKDMIDYFKLKYPELNL